MVGQLTHWPPPVTLFICLLGRQTPFLFKVSAFLVHDGLAPAYDELLAYLFPITRSAVNHGQCNHFLTMFFGNLLRSEAFLGSNVNSINECCCPCFVPKIPIQVHARNFGVARFLVFFLVVSFDALVNQLVGRILQQPVYVVRPQIERCSITAAFFVCLCFNFFL